MITIPKFNNRTADLRERGQAKGGKLSVSAKADDAVDLMLYDEIGYYGISARQFAETLSAIDAKTINLRINSPGGDVFDGIAMLNALKRHPANVIAHVEGLAASAASVVLLGADEVRMNQGSFLMIHLVWTVIAGNADEMRALAVTLDKIDMSLAESYAAKNGSTPEAMRALMAAETWFDAKEAVEQGLADSVVDQPAAKADFDLSLFNHVPDRLKAQSRSYQKPETLRDLETLLRDATGMSNAEAKSFTANLRSPRLRDEDMTGLEAVIRSFQKSA